MLFAWVQRIFRASAGAFASKFTTKYPLQRCRRGGGVVAAACAAVAVGGGAAAVVKVVVVTGPCR